MKVQADTFMDTRGMDEERQPPEHEWTLERVMKAVESGLTGSLGIRVLKFGPEEVVGEIAATEQTCQPFGMLHGGGFSSLAETLASIGALTRIDFPRQHAVGQNVSVQIVRPAPLGIVVTGSATCEFAGRTSQLWNVRMFNQADPERTLALARIQMAVITR